MKVQAFGKNESYLRAEVGPWDDERFDGQGGFAFGETAEVYVSEGRYGSDQPVFEVSQAAIGSHDTATARRRIAAYTLAADIADMLPRYSARGLSFESLAEALNNEASFALMLEEQRKMADPLGWRPGLELR